MAVRECGVVGVVDAAGVVHMVGVADVLFGVLLNMVNGWLRCCSYGGPPGRFGVRRAIMKISQQLHCAYTNRESFLCS